MELKDAFSYLENSKYGHSKDFTTLKKVLAIFNIDMDKFKIIQIAGTNGKGSVGTFLSTLLYKLNKDIGHFTSPHLVDYRERFKINGNIVDEKTFIEIVADIKDKLNSQLKDNLTYFEMAFVVSLIIFNRYRVEYIIIETGIGGRFDITNIFPKNILSIITTINYDHVDTLGNTLEEIAFHKAGIIKENSNVISFKHDENVDKILEREARTKNSSIEFLKREDLDILSVSSDGSKFIYKGYELFTKVLGIHQVYNICLSILALDKLNIIYDKNELMEIVREFYFEGRMEKIYSNPNIIIDGAHNEEGLDYLNKNIKNFDLKDYIIVFGSMSDKNILKNLQRLAEKAKLVIFTEIEYERAIEAEILVDQVEINKEKVMVLKPIEKVIDYLKDNLSKEDTIIITGSFYLVGEFKKRLLKEVKDV